VSLIFLVFNSLRAYGLSAVHGRLYIPYVKIEDLTPYSSLIPTRSLSEPSDLLSSGLPVFNLSENG
jgi:hypothetical protein